MRAAILMLAGAAFACAAEDPWTKVKQIKSGAEVRVVRDRVRQPIVAKFDEARDDSVVVVVKNEQVAIPRAEIERLDVRPPAPRMKFESQTKVTDPDASKPPTGPPAAGARQGTSTTGGLTFGSKPDFETVYRRPPGKK